MPADYPRVDLFLSFDYTGTTMKGMRSNFDWVVYRFIALAVFSLVATVEAQVVCRNNKDGVLVWSTKSSCPKGYSSFQKFIRANMMADNSVGTLQIADGAVTDSKIASVNWNKVQVSDNQIPWSKINTSNAFLHAHQIRGQITNDQISSVAWNKIQVNDNQIPWQKLDTNNLRTHDLWNVPFYVYSGSSNGLLPSDADDYGFMFPNGLVIPSYDMDNNLLHNHSICYKFLLQIKQSAPAGVGGRRSYYLYSDTGILEESECTIAGNSNECESSFEADRRISGFGIFFYNETWVSPAKVTWQITCAY